MLFFGVCFFLYFIKLSAGSGFCIMSYYLTIVLTLWMYDHAFIMQKLLLHFPDFPSHQQPDRAGAIYGNLLKIVYGQALNLYTFRVRIVI